MASPSIERIGSASLPSTKDGASLEQTLHSDDARINIRPDTSASSKIPSDWYIVDVNSNNES